MPSVKPPAGSAETPRVAVVIETSRSYGRALIRGVRRHAVEAGGWSMFADLRALDPPPPPWLAGWDGHGILTRTGTAALGRAVRAAGVPSVELRSARHNPDAPFVGVDNRALVGAVVDSFLEQGLRSFGVYALTSETYFRERSEGFAAEVAARGLPCEMLQQGEREKPRRWEGQQRRLADWVRSLPKPCGVLACTDQLGFWLLDACRRGGVAVPEEVSVVGVENDESLCDLADPPLSSVPLGGEQVGYEAAALLSRMMAGEDVPRGRRLIAPPPVVRRQSSDAAAVDDPDLAAALRFIRESAVRGVGVPDVLEAVAVSRRRLERLMRSAVGSTPGQEINRVRIEAARRLLAETDLTVAEVAARSGFPHAQHFSKLFRETEGLPPGEWRRRSGGRKSG